MTPPDLQKRHNLRQIAKKFGKSPLSAFANDPNSMLLQAVGCYVRGLGQHFSNQVTPPDLQKGMISRIISGRGNSPKEIETIPFPISLFKFNFRVAF